MNFDLNLTSYIKINSIWIIDLNVKQSYETFRKKVGENLYILRLGKRFSDLTTKT